MCLYDVNSMYNNFWFHIHNVERQDNIIKTGQKLSLQNHEVSNHKELIYMIIIHKQIVL